MNIAEADIPEIDVAELDRRRSAGAAVFDVREPDEYLEVRIPGVIAVPLAGVADEIEQFRRNETLFVVCAKGGRSAAAVEYLRGHGIDAVNVTGGTSAWLEAGLPTASGPGPDKDADPA